VLEAGQVIDAKYRIVGLLGVGGMGAVYEGENSRIKRRVAIKVLHAATASSSQAVERFEREAQAAGRIGSDHILEVLDLGKLENGDHYMVMEFLDGETLGARIERAGGLAPREVAPLIRQALLGLQAAHAAGIVHRDLKPENIFICKAKAGHADFVKLIDFGVSKFKNPPGSEMSKTRTGAVVGTPHYMSPEQAQGGRDIDHRSDLYSMGVILYQAVTGQVPFDGNTFNELLFKIVLSEPPSLRELRPDVDAAFEAITQKAMARDPAQRFASADEFVQAIDSWVATSSAVVEPEQVPAIPAGAGWAQTPSAPRTAKIGPLIAIGASVLALLIAVVTVAAWRVARRASDPTAIGTESVPSPPAPLPPAEPTQNAPADDQAASAEPEASGTRAKKTKGKPTAPKPSAKQTTKPPDWGY
jgi:eukaryotic-like serine/threonine-protein kinase